MTILVTAATGTVGRNVIEELVKRGADVRALVRDPAKTDFPAGVTAVKSDLLDVDSLRSATCTEESGSWCDLAPSPRKSPCRYIRLGFLLR